MIRACHLESGNFDFTFNPTSFLPQWWNQAGWDKNEVSCSEPEGVLYLGWHLAMFGIFLVVLTGVVSGIQWPEARAAVARHLIMLLTKEKLFRPKCQQHWGGGAYAQVCICLVRFLYRFCSPFRLYVNLITMPCNLYPKLLIKWRADCQSPPLSLPGQCG